MFILDPRTPSAINTKNAAVLYEVFQRVGALDLYFGLQRDIHNDEYPLQNSSPKQGNRSRTFSRQSSSIQSDDASTTMSEEAMTCKAFTVDLCNQSKLIDREQLMDPGYDGEKPSDSLLVDGQETAASALADKSAINSPSKQSRHMSSLKTVKWSSIDTNLSETNVDVNDMRCSNKGTRSRCVSTQCPPVEGSAYSNNVSASHYNGSINNGIEECQNLMLAKSLRMSELHLSSRQSNTEWEHEKPDVHSDSSRRSSKSSKPEGPKRLRIALWFERWFIPNLFASFSLLRNTLFECSGGVQQYFTPLKLAKPNKKFNEVYLSSLEYAILKDELTRCYFYITDDHKEHLMMREVDDFRRLNMRKRITFEEFCYHFLPYLSRNPEDYTRNKNLDTAEEALQRRALQRVLEKNLYGISIERPNEFFNKQCILKPFQVLEPIPQK
ncbi:uncharacterized protein BXIN_3001 [Babesia sp. Xinjiang]|uniref:uncharacterized protein n=1 Tax=Babesia sp. Xinjiang TaxID=462227 RepID=UPI000A246F41|nr:uncharacterized protein BXIN_3001 [Babesia sp. Xinjiang]ORM39395.1 hypothetical protein BXIN_3001 [Babesia sp. Xinjiang]